MNNYITPTFIYGWIDDNYSLTTQIIDIDKINNYIQKTFLTKTFTIDIFSDEIFFHNNQFKHNSIYYGVSLPIYSVEQLMNYTIPESIDTKIKALYMAYCEYHKLNYNEKNIKIFNVIKTDYTNIFNSFPKYDLLE